MNLTAGASNNSGSWNNPQFNQLVQQAETLSGDARIKVYNQAEQIAVSDVGWLPLDHEAVAGIIPSWVHGLTLNANGLFFDDWSGVYITQH